jgi:hypothetical protein
MLDDDRLAVVVVMMVMMVNDDDRVSHCWRGIGKGEAECGECGK